MSEIATPEENSVIEYFWHNFEEVIKVKSTGERTSDGKLMVNTNSGLGSFGGLWRYPGEKEWRR